MTIDINYILLSQNHGLYLIIINQNNNTTAMRQYDDDNDNNGNEKEEKKTQENFAKKCFTHKICITTPMPALFS